jgi:hypothetical protein
MATIVFDLDMTLVDSSHRHASKPDGSIDLAHWFQNCHLVVNDTLLPLARAVRTFYDAGNDVVFCTARCMQQADYDWLNERSDILPHHALYSRQGYFVGPDSAEWENSYHGFIGDSRGDGEIKMQQIMAHIQAKGFRNFADAQVIIFEDNLKTLDLFKQNRAIGIDATKVNGRLAA